jgi:hypothetical protein
VLGKAYRHGRFDCIGQIWQLASVITRSPSDRQAVNPRFCAWWVVHSVTRCDQLSGRRSHVLKRYCGCEPLRCTGIRQAVLFCKSFSTSMLILKIMLLTI